MSFFLLAREPDGTIGLLSTSSFDTQDQALTELSRLTASADFSAWDAHVFVATLGDAVPVLLVRPSSVEPPYEVEADDELPTQREELPFEAEIPLVEHLPAESEPNEVATVLATYELDIEEPTAVDELTEDVDESSNTTLAPDALPHTDELIAAAGAPLAVPELADESAQPFVIEEPPIAADAAADIAIFDDSAPELAGEPEPDPEGADEIQLEPEAAPELAAQAEDATQPEPEPETEPGVGLEPEPETEPDAALDTEPEEHESGVTVEPDAPLEPAGEQGSDAPLEPEAEQASDVATEPEPELAPETENEPESDEPFAPEPAPTWPWSAAAEIAETDEADAETVVDDASPADGALVADDLDGAEPETEGVAADEEDVSPPDLEPVPDLEAEEPLEPAVEEHEPAESAAEPEASDASEPEAPAPEGYRPSEGTLDELTCQDCIYVETCPSSGDRLPSACGTFQWK